jgi:DNA-binding response OmpR family regulator
MRILLLRQKIKLRISPHLWLRQKFIVDDAFSPADFFEKFYARTYDLLIVDLNRASFDVEKILTEVRAERPTLPVVCFLDEQSRLSLQKFLSYQFSSLICQQSMVENHDKSNNIKLGKLNFNFADNSFLLRDRILPLPRREALLLTQLFINRSHFLSRDTISKYLLKDCAAVKSNLVDVYIYRLRKILRQNSPDLRIKYHHYLGYQISHCNHS